MKAISKRIVVYCVQHNIVTEDEIPWLQYGIEKRISTFLVLIPFFLLALYLTDFYAALSFLGAFYMLRERTGGFHAKTIAACVCISLLTETGLLIFLYPLYNPILLLCSNVVSVALTFILAPHNHPNMHLSDSEIQAMKKTSRKVVFILLLGVIISWFMGFFSIAKGLTAGIAMATFFLCLAYINDWRVLHENKRRNDL